MNELSINFDYCKYCNNIITIDVQINSDKEYIKNFINNHKLIKETGEDYFCKIFNHQNKLTMCYLLIRL